MPTRGDWSMEVRVGGTAIKEHSIDGHKVVTAAPNKEFEVAVDYAGFDGLYLLECRIDGQMTGPRYFLDPARETGRGGARGLVFKDWTKSQDGHEVKRRFLFQGASALAGDDDEGSSRPAVASWEHGKVEIMVFQGVKAVLQQDTTSASHNADMSARPAVDEKTMVKSGLSVAAGTGATSFGRVGSWRAGETYVARPAVEVLLCKLTLFFRDSFFMALREDTCCNGACAPRQEAASSSTLRAAADELAAGGAAGGMQAQQVRDKAVRERETREALARKRPKDEAPIDLCDS